MATKFWSSRSTEGHAQVAPISIPLRSLADPHKLQTKIVVEGELTDNLHGAGHPIVSARLIAALGSRLAPDPCPVEIDGTDEPYFLLRPGMTVNMISWKQCEGIEWSGGKHSSPVKSFKTLVVNEENAPGPDEMYTPSGFPGLVAIHPELAATLESSFSGLHFIDASKVTLDTTPPTAAETKATKKLIEQARKLGANTAHHVTIDDDAPLDEQGDDWWFNQGAEQMEGLDETNRGLVSQAFVAGFVAEAEAIRSKPKKAKTKPAKAKAKPKAKPAAKAKPTAKAKPKAKAAAKTKPKTRAKPKKSKR